MKTIIDQLQGDDQTALKLEAKKVEKALSESHDKMPLANKQMKVYLNTINFDINNIDLQETLHVWQRVAMDDEEAD